MRINGLSVNYCDLRGEGLDRDPGRGRAVVFLHGWGSDFSIFREFLDRIAVHCRAWRVCAPNLPGFGGSGEPPEAWGVDEYADFVLDFLAALDIREAVLIGHSFGGRIAIKLAARENLGNLPVKIPKMILVDSAGIRPHRTARQTLRLFAYKTARRVLSVSAVQKIFPGLLDALRNKTGSEDYRNASPRMRQCLVKTVNEDLTPCLPSISCPTLLIWGENDTAAPIADGRLMERLIPDAGLVTLKNAGHYSFLDQSYAFGRVLDSFLGVDKKLGTE